jgi:glycosyltransferase involved in cell wall biosynthesis
MPSLLVVVPTYNQFDYAIHAIRTALAHTTQFDTHVAVVDDASPDRLNKTAAYAEYVTKLEALQHEFGRRRITTFSFDSNGGLTRSWNAGLRIACRDTHDFCCITNSDVLFAPGWDVPLLPAIRQGFDLLGPVTNTPGTEKEQYVGNYSVVYDKRHKDDTEHIAAVQQELATNQGSRVKISVLNGFCLFGAVRATWWDTAYSATDVFCPVNTLNARGRKNPTPLMTLNEYEFQTRLHARGRRSGICLGSYVYHYRAVSRGDKYKRGDWARIQQKESIHDNASRPV